MISFLGDLLDLLLAVSAAKSLTKSTGTLTTIPSDTAPKSAMGLPTS